MNVLIGVSVVESRDKNFHIPQKACLRGHWLRYAKGRSCVECSRARNRRLSPRSREEFLRTVRRPELVGLATQEKTRWHQAVRRKRRLELIVWVAYIGLVLHPGVVRQREGERRRTRQARYAYRQGKILRLRCLAWTNEGRKDWIRMQQRARRRDPKIRVQRRDEKRRRGQHKRRHLWTLQRGQCYWCAAAFPQDAMGVWEVDHVIPVSRGGVSSRENLVLSCVSCNQRKGAKMPHEFAGRLF